MAVRSLVSFLVSCLAIAGGAEDGRVVVAGYTRTETSTPYLDCVAERSDTIKVTYVEATATCVRVAANVQLVALEPEHTRVLGPAPAP